MAGCDKEDYFSAPNAEVHNQTLTINSPNVYFILFLLLLCGIGTLRFANLEQDYHT